MKNVLATGITSSSQQPYTKKTHEWYNDMTKEVAEAFVKSLIPSSWYTGKLVILNGCELTGTNPSVRTISEGWVWYDGEIFRVEAGEFTTTGLEIGIWSINTASTNLTFSDDASKPVHQERTFVMSNGLSGSGLFDEGDVEKNTFTEIVEIGAWNMDTTTDVPIDLSSFITDTTKIISLDCIVFHDSGIAAKLETVNNSTFLLEGAIGSVNPITKVISLFRKTGGVFDSISFSTRPNRGYLTVKYLL